jgi:2-haloacid dehalogenase
MKYKLLIFDLDDTLFDYTQTEKNAIEHTCNNIGIFYSGNLYDQYKKANNIVKCNFCVIDSKNIFEFRYNRAREFLALINYPQVNINQFIEIYLENSTVGVLIENVQNTLELLKGIKKVVATNGTNYPRLNKLMNSTIYNYFDAYYSAENLQISKPDPVFYIEIIKKHDVRKEEVLIIGDDYATDITGAILTGIDSCWFDYRKKRKGMSFPDNVHIISDFNEIIDYVMGGGHE